MEGTTAQQNVPSSGIQTNQTSENSQTSQSGAPLEHLPRSMSAQVTTGGVTPKRRPDNDQLGGGQPTSGASAQSSGQSGVNFRSHANPRNAALTVHGVPTGGKMSIQQPAQPSGGSMRGPSGMGNRKTSAPGKLLSGNQLTRNNTVGPRDLPSGYVQCSVDQWCP